MSRRSRIVVMPRSRSALSSSCRQSGHLRGWLLGALIVGGLFAAWAGTRLHWGEALRPAAFAYPASGEKKCAALPPPANAELPSVLVRAPSNYDPAHAHPLLIVFSPAGLGPGLTERHTGLTHAATARGVIVAYVGSRRLEPTLPARLATLPARLAQDWCIDAARISFAGHSDGGTLAQITALQPASAALRPRAVFASAAGVVESDFAALSCPEHAEVLLMHGRADDHFPGYGESAAAGWARCLGCASAPSTDADGCLAYRGCRGTLRLCLHDGVHLDWPDRANPLLLNLAETPR